MEIYRDHEKEFSKHYSNANRKFNQYSSGESDHLFSEIKASIDQAEKLLNLMENDLRGMDSQQSTQLQKKFYSCKENLHNLKNSLNSTRTRKEKENLLGNHESAKREKMLTNNEILQETGEILQDTHKIAIETEGIGYDAMNALKNQRKQIQNIGEKVNDVGANVTQANQKITIMNNRRIVMKIIMMATIVLLVIAFAISLYIKFG